MKKIILFILSLSILFVLPGCGGGGNGGEAPSIHWAKSYGGGSDDEANSIQQTSDGGFIVAGYTDSFSAGRRDFWVIKLDSSGNILWQKTYGGTNSDSANSIQQTSDGGYIVAGGGGNSDFWVIKLDSSGSILWQKSYGTAGVEFVSSIIQTSDSGYIVAGITGFPGHHIIIGDFWVLRLKSDGTISPSAPPNIGADSFATVQDTFVVPSDTFVTPVDSTATVTNTNVTGVDSNATVQTQASD